ncbi:MAG: Rne/Rng family ribonuclease [Candidatus Omnitrophica bacterium]|nr:Rne/Rng family ribonuclease [Candidatus Omnitrophota bacterium]
MVLVSQEIGETSIAIVENNVLEEFYIERESARKIYGNIYRGKVKAVVPGINAVFVDIGMGKDGFLYLHDVDESDLESDAEFFNDIVPTKPNKGSDLAKTVKVGDEITVQVVKEAIRNKGPRLTTKISIPARYLVLTTDRTQLGISRRINDKAERERIRAILAESKLTDNVGFIVRTVAEGKTKREFNRDIKYLLNVWREVQVKLKKAKAPSLVHEELNLVERIIRDTFTEDTSKIITDSEVLHRKIAHFLKRYIPEYRANTDLYKEKVPLFVKYKIDRDIETAYLRKVPLKSGGYIVIEQTEGMTAIDVNSGRFKDKKDIEATAFRTNIDAAKEVVRQLRLRDIGGIIIIDFIDMNMEKHKRELMKVLKDSVVRDKAKINILKMSEIGVVEMTRQRIRDSKESSIYQSCPYCTGRGVIKSLPTMRIQVLKELRQKAGIVKNKQIFVALHPAIAEDVMQSSDLQIQNIEQTTNNKIVVLADPSMHREEIAIDY